MPFAGSIVGVQREAQVNEEVAQVRTIRPSTARQFGPFYVGLHGEPVQGIIPGLLLAAEGSGHCAKQGGYIAGVSVPVRSLLA